MALSDFFEKICTVINKRTEESQELQQQKDLRIQNDIKISGEQFINRYGSHFHCQNEQYIRFQRAISCGDIGYVMSVDRENLAMSIRSSTDNSKVYNVSFSHCDCEDFARRKLPCKHMYKLALELGVIDSNWDISGIPTELKNTFDSLPFSDKVSLLNLLINYPASRALFEVKRKDVPESLIRTGLVEETTDRADFYQILDKNYTKNDIFVALATAKNDYTPTSSSTKKEMISWILDNDEKLLLKLYKKHYCIRLSLEVANCKEYIIRQYKDYLNR